MSDNMNGFPVPEEPETREEQYLSAIAQVTPATQIPEEPLTRIEAYLDKIVENGGGGGGGFVPTQAQLDAMNSGIDSEKVAQIETNETNISSEQAKTTGMTEGGSNYITIGGIRVYVSATAPTGDIPDGSVGVGW